MAFPRGVDVASWQGNIDWQAAKADGTDFAFIKATQGTSYRSPTYLAQSSTARQAGVLVSPYHFATDDDGRSQAAFFLSVAPPRIAGDLPHMVDAETDPATHRDPTAQVLVDMGRVLREATGKRPILYTTISYYYGKLQGSSELRDIYDLFVASWFIAKPLTGPWDRWLFWQYSNQGVVAGINGRVDVDYFNGSLEELHALTGAPSVGRSLPSTEEDDLPSIAVPDWAVVVGGATPHFRLVKTSQYGWLLQGLNGAQVQGTDGIMLKQYLDGQEPMGIAMSPDGRHVVVARYDGHTLEFATGTENPSVQGIQGLQGPGGPPGAKGDPGPQGPAGAVDYVKLVREVGQQLAKPS